MDARQIMTDEVVAVNMTATVEEAARLLVGHQIMAVPVVDDANRVVGIVNLNDLFPKLRDMRFSGQRMAHLFNSLINMADLPDYYWSARKLPVTEVMNRQLPSLSVDDTLAEVASQLLYSDYHSLPVVEADGQLVGIISRMDLIRVSMKIDEGGDE